jgi:hypothetical protein
MDLTKISLPGQQLLITTIPDDHNQRLDKYVEHISPTIRENEENGWMNRLFGNRVDMNRGIFDGFTFDQATLLSTNQRFIIDYAFQLLSSAGFHVDKHNGYFNVDVFEVDTETPVESQYTNGGCDNHISMVLYDSCVFYTRKDNDVKGDLAIYIRPPTLFENGTKSILPVRERTAVLRSGDVCYDVGPHHGKGTLHMITVCFERLTVRENDLSFFVIS